jgi:diaminohydroxyphosphoribosylaminopyrimidine deaminase / 5-amino-6-(5-phosphoribosylamino)uracil reductase
VNISAQIDERPHARIDQAFVFGQLGQTLDGRIACPNGVSKYINGSDALDHLHGLRAEADAVLVGVGTVVADDPQLTVRRCNGSTPRAVVIDPQRRTPPGAGVFEAGDEPPLFVRRADDIRGDEDIGVAGIVDPDGTTRLDPVDIVACLCARGYCRILIEGGASTLSQFIDHRAIDRLDILMAPIILGSGVNGLNLKPIFTLDDALRPDVRLKRFADGDVLYECTLKSVWSR